MANSKKVKRTYICQVCKGNGYVRIHNIHDYDLSVHQCWECDSQGEHYEYEEEERVLH